VNVDQSKPKFYRKPFHIGLLDYIYAPIARATLHLKGQDNRRILHLQVDYQGEILKAQLITKK